MPIYATIINFYANTISIFFKFKCNYPLYMPKLTQTRPVLKSAQSVFLHTVLFCKMPKDMSAVNKKRPLSNERPHVYELNLSQFI